MTSKTGQEIIAIHILPKSQGVKATRQWNLVNQSNITWEIFLLKNHTLNGEEKLFADPFKKSVEHLLLPYTKPF